jgi:VWFA-related protein
MRKRAILLVMSGVALQALAAKHVTVEQLEPIVTAARSRPDADVARQLSDLDLTERLSAARFAQWKSNFPGEKAQQAFVALADRSGFLDPPAAEIPATATPDFAAQRKIMALTVAYVGKTIPQLPNFFATRKTSRFEDTPQLQRDDFTIPFVPLHAIGNSSVTVSYRDGREAIESKNNKKPEPMSAGLNTVGVFGPVLSTVLLDAAQSKLTWKHWEQGATGIQAVFSYAVPREKSHYDVSYCCVAEQAATAVADMHPFHKVVGYHGEMAVDPASGTILRLVVEAELKTDDPVSKAGIFVEYGPVEIGGKTYFCPVKSVSLSLAQMVQLVGRYQTPVANQLQPLVTSLNDTAFEEYHLFRADTLMVTEDEAASVGALPPLGGKDAQSEKTEDAIVAPSTASPNRAAATEGDSVAPRVLGTSQGATLVAGEQPLPSPPPALPEISVTESNGIPDAPADLPRAGDESGFTLHTSARLVDVGLVAFDKKGQPVTDLKPGDLEIYDNGQKQEIRFFSPAGTATPDQPAAQGRPAFSNRRTASDGSGAGAQPGNVTILLLDESNLAFGDLTYAREEMLRFLKTVPATEPVGLYLMKSHGFQVLKEATTDHESLAAALAKWMPSAQDLARAQDEEARNRQDIEYVHSVADLLHTNGNTPNGGSDSTMAIDPQLRSLGSNPSFDILVVLPGIARRLASVAGHKSLVWVASDNVLADFSDKAPSAERGNKYLEPLTLGAQEALNEAHISIYPLDVSQLEAGGVSASVAENNVQLAPTANVQAQLAALPPSEREEAEEALEKSQRNVFSGRLTAQMQQDTHPIQGTFRELAQATGGRAFRRASDIASELNGVIADGRAAYLLSFTPDQPADGKYHLLTIKLTSRRDVTLRYRTGYSYSKEPATLKDRFRQAIWQPMDASEIGISASTVSSAGGSTVRLNIAATDLGLAQQGELFVDKLDIFMVQRDDAALHAQVTGQTLGLRLKPATYQKVLHDGIPFDQAIGAKPETGSIRIVVVDQNSGRMGSITLPAAVIAEKR